nr:MAG TPA: hypothetical protein [Caudoviricetes sp.]
MAEYEGLEFTVTEDISKSVKDIKRLSSALKDLKTALEAVKGMNVGNELKNLADQLSQIEGKDTSTLKELGEALRNTGDGVSKLNKTIQAMDISKFKDNMHGIAESVKELDLDRLSKLSEATQGLKGLGALSNVKQGTGATNALGNKQNVAAPQLDTSKQVYTGNVLESFTQSLKNGASKIQSIYSGILSNGKSFTDKFKRIFDSLKNNTALQKFGGFIKGIAGNSFGKFGEGALGLGNKLGYLANQFARVAMYRFIRTVIKEITQAMVTGVNNVYAYSTAIGGSLAPAMDSIATSGLYASNALGAMASPILESLAPAIDFLIDKFVALINIINQFFAFLGGHATWTKAIKQQTKFNNELGKGGGAARQAKKELDLYLASFDELHVMNDPNKHSSGGGGGAGGGLDPSSMFEQAEFDGPVADFANRIKELFANKDWKGLGIFIGESINKGINAIDWKGMGRTVGKGIDAVFTVSYNFMKTVRWDTIGSKVGDFLNEAMYQIDWNQVGRTIAQGFLLIPQMILGLVTTLDWSAIVANLVSSITGFLNEIADVLDSYDWSAIGNQLGTEFGEMLKEVDWLELGKSVLHLFTSAVEAAIDFAGGVLDGLGEEIFGDLFKGMKKKWNEVKQWYLDTFWWIKDLIELIFGKSKDTIESTTRSAADIGNGNFSRMRDGIANDSNEISNTVSDRFRKANTSVTSNTGLMSSSATRNFNDMGIATERNMSNINSVVERNMSKTYGHTEKNFTSMNSTASANLTGMKYKADTSLSAIESKFNYTRLTFPSISFPYIPLPHFSISGSANPLTWIQDGLPKINVEWYEKGGFPDMGQMFVAREAGPELVGNIGNKNAVVNNMQIIEGIKQGVSEAMRGVQGNGDSHITINLDGKVVYDNVVQRNNEHVAMTGESEFAY